MTTTRAALLGALLLAPLAAGAQPALPPPAEMQRGVASTATVEAVDRRTREITLRAADGELETFTAPADMRNFDRIRRGDRVVAQMTGAVSLALAQGGSAGVPVAAFGAGRRPEGERPGIGAMAAAGFRARVQAVNPQTGRVTFAGPSGEMRSIVARTPELREFIRRLAPGDEVDVGLAQLASLSVEPRVRR